MSQMFFVFFQFGDHPKFLGSECTTGDGIKGIPAAYENRILRLYLLAARKIFTTTCALQVTYPENHTGIADVMVLNEGVVLNVGVMRIENWRSN